MAVASAVKLLCNLKLSYTYNWKFALSALSLQIFSDFFTEKFLE